MSDLVSKNGNRKCEQTHSVLGKQDLHRCFRLLAHKGAHMCQSGHIWSKPFDSEDADDARDLIRGE